MHLHSSELFLPLELATSRNMSPVCKLGEPPGTRQMPEMGHERARCMKYACGDHRLGHPLNKHPENDPSDTCLEERHENGIREVCGLSLLEHGIGAQPPAPGAIVW